MIILVVGEWELMISYDVWDLYSLTLAEGLKHR